jgi:isoamylase
MKIQPGANYPLGATYDGTGTNFAILSEVAERVELCLFDDDGRETRVPLPVKTDFCWHGYLPGVGPGQRYGFRVHGPWAPDQGHLCLPEKLLLDPYAKAVAGALDWHDAFLARLPDAPEGEPNRDDSAPFCPKSVVVDTAFDWGDDRSPATPLRDAVIYEVHVKGFTFRNPDIPQELRGTYAGLGHPAAIEHLRRLGVTAVELLPVHQFAQAHRSGAAVHRNYWGYSTLGFFAPHNEYATAGKAGSGVDAARGHQVREFKEMVRALHAAGIEVFLDVVYNHTAEGNHLGPMLSLKGFDNAAYYRLMPDERQYYEDFTGTGNSLNLQHPHTQQLVCDSLRYWVQEMHVDGFRFDLAVTLGRGEHDMDRRSPFFDIVQQDPILRRAKLIAEPWDLGNNGYQLGNFPPLWSEWNGAYRDTVRDFWQGAEHPMGEFASRFTGSSDLYAASGRPPAASINFVTVHDGFTLADLVSYNEKHNQDNGEDNHDGESNNRSCNFGVEGPTDDPAVLALRHRQQRNFLATLMLSQGVPMLLGGDELGRTQHGNNNAYCQDNEVSWFDWQAADRSLLAFATELIALRRNHPVFRRQHWFAGQPLEGQEAKDIAWYRLDGAEMEEHDWQEEGRARTLGLFLNGRAIAGTDSEGNPLADDSFYLLFNASAEDHPGTLPHGETWGHRWVLVLDTDRGEVHATGNGDAVKAGDALTLPARSLRVYREVPAASS